MAIPKINKNNVLDALKFIDENGVPSNNKSTQYDLIGDNGKKYPPKYVIAVADHIANGTEIAVDTFNAVEAKSFLSKIGFHIEYKLEKYTLTITADNVTSTDERFSMNNLEQGDYYKPLKAYFEKADGTVIKRNYAKGEYRISNQTMPRIAFQVYEKQISALSAEEKEKFPTCRYSLNSETYCGIFSKVEDYLKVKNTLEYLTYGYGDGRQFVIYSWNIFSTVVFVQECLKRFGEPGDKFKLIYRDKDKKETKQETAEAKIQEELVQQFKEYRNPYSQTLIESKNIIFRGAPGTGKS